MMKANEAKTTVTTTVRPPQAPRPWVSGQSAFASPAGFSRGRRRDDFTRVLFFGGQAIITVWVDEEGEANKQKRPLVKQHPPHGMAPPPPHPVRRFLCKVVCTAHAFPADVLTMPKGNTQKSPPLPLSCPPLFLRRRRLSFTGGGQEGANGGAAKDGKGTGKTRSRSRGYAWVGAHNMAFVVDAWRGLGLSRSAVDGWRGGGGRGKHVLGRTRFTKEPLVCPSLTTVTRPLFSIRPCTEGVEAHYRGVGGWGVACDSPPAPSSSEENKHAAAASHSPFLSHPTYPPTWTHTG